MWEHKVVSWKKGTTAMALAKNEVCGGWLNKKCYLVGRN